MTTSCNRGKKSYYTPQTYDKLYSKLDDICRNSVSNKDKLEAVTTIVKENYNVLFPRENNIVCNIECTHALSYPCYIIISLTYIFQDNLHYSSYKTLFCPNGKDGINGVDGKDGIN
jgi:hypothetical protein